jgi:hypothetical protein
MLFAFEADFAQDLRCIPMVVRWKLDRCGIKLKLAHWLKLSLAQRQWLIDRPLDAQYAQQLQAWVEAITGAPASSLPIPERFDWQNPEHIPHQIQEQMAKLALPPLSLSQWRNLGELQRFVLIKLTSPHHENRNLIPALREFGLLDRGTI